MSIKIEPGEGFVLQVCVRGEGLILAGKEYEIELSLTPPINPPEWGGSSQLELIVVFISHSSHLRTTSGNRKRWVIPREGVAQELIFTVLADKSGKYEITIDFFESRTLMLMEEYEVSVEVTG